MTIQFQIDFEQKLSPTAQIGMAQAETGRNALEKMESLRRAGRPLRKACA